MYKKIFFKITATAIFLFFNSQLLKATTGLGKSYLYSKIELKQIQKDVVQITGNLVSENGSYFLLEKSVDNNNFKTVTIIFAVTGEDHFYTPVLLKDKTKSSKKVYYQVKEVHDEKETLIYSGQIDLQ
jgi:hypothetical protein